MRKFIRNVILGQQKITQIQAVPNAKESIKLFFQKDCIFPIIIRDYTKTNSNFPPLRQVYYLFKHYLAPNWINVDFVFIMVKVQFLYAFSFQHSKSIYRYSGIQVTERAERVCIFWTARAAYRAYTRI